MFALVVLGVLKALFHKLALQNELQMHLMEYEKSIPDDFPSALADPPPSTHTSVLH